MLQIYCESLAARATQITHSSESVEKTSDMFIGSTTSTTPLSIDNHGSLEYFSNSFWANCNSLYDIVANTASCVYNIENRERNVSFYKLSIEADKVKNQNSTIFSISLSNAVLNASKALTYKRLVKYRNCSLHRRTICLKQQRVTESVNAAYTGMTDGVITTSSKHFVCDDPYSINPSFSKNRELLPEIKAIQKRTFEDINKIVRQI